MYRQRLMNREPRMKLKGSENHAIRTGPILIGAKVKALLPFDRPFVSHRGVRGLSRCWAKRDEC
jgi:hypothetical protein